MGSLRIDRSLYVYSFDELMLYGREELDDSLGLEFDEASTFDPDEELDNPKELEAFNGSPGTFTFN